MTTKKPHASAGTKSPASSEKSTASTVAKTAEKPPTDSVAGNVASASSKATKRAYASDVPHFILHGGAIPATPTMVAEYLAKLAPIMKMTTLERRCVSSLRAGYVTTAAMASLPTWLIREQTGHRSDTVLARYIRPVEKRKIPSLL